MHHPYQVSRTRNTALAVKHARKICARRPFVARKKIRKSKRRLRIFFFIFASFFFRFFAFLFFGELREEAAERELYKTSDARSALVSMETRVSRSATFFEGFITALSAVPN